MVPFLARRLLATVPILLGIVLLVMLTVDFIPGDPVALMLGEGATQEMITRVRASLGLDQPLPVRYARYVGRLVRGDLGRSVVDGRRVSEELSDAWRTTLQLGGAALVIAVIVGVTVGIFSAYKVYSLFDNLVRVVSLAGLSMPIFWTGLVLILVFSVWLRWLPTGGRGGWEHLIMPAVTLATPSIAMLARMTRSAMLDVLREDYIRTARAKGVRTRTILGYHALRNALIPIVTVLGLQMGQLLGGSVLSETVFSWPGMGRVLVRAVLTRDYTLLQGGVLLLATTFVVVNLLVDLSYAYLDPRVMYR
ncbi:MAG: ABC transporter permease [Armatimonadetes bacterium]|nr:ABC transporter permease [Armatimonadota bacterium]